MPYCNVLTPWSLRSFCISVCLLLTAQATLSAARCKPGPSAEAGSLQPVSLFDTPKVFAPCAERQDATALAQIANTVSLYSLALDGKDFSQLKNVFFEDAVANYSAPIGVLQPLSVIEKTIGGFLAPVTTQHQLGTQVIDLLPGGCKARSLTYLISSHFGRGKYEGEVLYAYCQYQDVLAKDQDGNWKIQIRLMQYMVSAILFNR